jgi:5-methylcytosine-specific restriction endonuclease McrBC regulatory subunit McrC
MRYLKYVFNFSKEKILDHETPASIKNKIIANINAVEKYFSSLVPLQTDKLIIHNSDPIIIRKTKEQGNIILSYERTHFKAWRIDFSTVFEKYIQYLFMELSKNFGWDIKQNIKFSVLSNNVPGWGMNYFEPDILLSKGIYSIAIDAKYKSHLFNLQSSSDYLKTEHRFDLHQITAYCAFQEGKQKIGFLCYPSTTLHWRKLRYSNIYSSTEVGIYLFGIPITSSNIKKITSDLQGEFEKILINERIISTTNA